MEYNRMGCGMVKNKIHIPGEALDELQLRINKKGIPVHHYERSETRPQNNDLIAKLFEAVFVGEAEQMLAVKPWIGALKPPTVPPSLQNSLPSISLELEYVYGYRVFDSRKNLYYTSDPRVIVYCAAALGVLLNKTNNQQRFFGAGLVKSANGHSDSITALAIHSDREKIATAEVGNNPQIHIWNTSFPESPPLHSFSLGRGHRGITSLSFSHDGSYLACADLHNDHYISVFSLQNNTQISQKKTGPDKILDLSWSQNKPKFLSAGIKHLNFWKITLKFKLKHSKGDFSGVAERSNMTAAGWLSNGTAISGAFNGQIYQWKKNILQRSVQVHEFGHPVHCMVVVEDRVFSGGKDNKVFELNSELITVRVCEFESCPRAIDYKNGFLLVGTRNGKIFEVLTDGAMVELMDSHFDGEVWGLAVDNLGNLFTAADDNQIKIWDPSLKKCITTAIIDKTPNPPTNPNQSPSSTQTSLNQQSRTISINTQTEHLALGHNSGQITIRSIPIPSTVLFTLSTSQSSIQILHYSPNNCKLAAGSHDHSIYIYNVFTDYQLEHKLTGHHSFITALDWSVDSSAIHSTSADFELLFWDVFSGLQEKDGADKFKDEGWSQWTCPLGWPVRGIFGLVNEFTHVNAVSRAPCGNIVAVGNDWGLVEVLEFPNGEGAKKLGYRAHGEHVVNVRWSEDGKYLFSAGGYDQAVMQWKVSFL